MRFSGTKIEKLTGLPSVTEPNQFYLVEFRGLVELYLSSTTGELILLGTNMPIDAIMVDQTEIVDGEFGKVLYHKTGDVVGQALAEIAVVENFEMDLDDSAEQVAFTIPSGFDFILTKVILRQASADASSSAEFISIKDADGNPVIEEDVAIFDATNTYIVKRNDAITPLYPPGSQIVFQMSSAIGTPITILADIFGYFRVSNLVPVTFLSVPVTFLGYDVTFTP